MQLRDYQLRAIDELREHRAERPILVAPTGSGKTVIAAELIRRATCKGRRVLFAVHRRELVAQAVARLEALGVQSGVILAGTVTDARQRVQVASIQTIARRDKPPAEILIVDEAHHATAETWRDLIDYYQDATIIGLTATPWRLSGAPLGDIFGCIVAPISVRELCDAGVLIEPRVYAPPGPNLSGVRTSGGDYASGQLAARMAPLVGNMIEHWRKHADGRRTVAFGVNIEHSEIIRDRFISAGVRAAHIDGGTPTELRESVLADLASGALTVVSNCMILGEGWDLPALEVAILARPTKSLALHLQQIGRIMRACDGKESALVLDHAGNHHRHGSATDDRVWSLTEPAPEEKSESGVNTCKSCFGVIPFGARVCPLCGADQPTPEIAVPDETEGELEEWQNADRPTVYRDLIAQANAGAYRLGWARHKYKARFGVWPRNMRDIEAAYVCEVHEPELKTYGYKTRRICARCWREIPA